MGANSNARPDGVSGLSGQVGAVGLDEHNDIVCSLANIHGRIDYYTNGGHDVPCDTGADICRLIRVAINAPHLERPGAFMAPKPVRAPRDKQYREALEEAEQVLDQYADLKDDGEGGSRPNAAARALQTVRNALKGASS